MMPSEQYTSVNKLPDASSTSRPKKVRVKYKSLNDLTLSQEKKSGTLVKATEIVLGLDDEVLAEIDVLDRELRDLDLGVQDLREAIVSIKEQNQRMQEAIKELATVQAVVTQLENDADVQAALKNRASEVQVGTAPKSSKASRLSVKGISLMSVADYEAVPTYTRGRIKLEDVNDFIKSFNMTIEKKYMILKFPNSAKYKDKQMHFTFKMQQTLCPDATFCTEDDLKSFGFVYSLFATSKMLNILRAAYRIRELRVKGNVFLIIP